MSARAYVERDSAVVLGAALLFVAQSAAASEATMVVEDRYEGVVAAPVPTEPWWSEFEDGQLTALVVAALRDNHDVDAAESRLAQAAAGRQSAASSWWPVVSFDASGTIGPTSGLGAAFGGLPDRPDSPPRPANYYAASLMLNARLSLDVWGRQFLRYRAARQQEEASQHQLDLVAMLLAHQVGAAYFDAVSAAEQLSVLQEQVQRNAELLEIIELRFRQGEATAIDVLQQKQQLAAAKARVPAARAMQRMSRQKLAVLIGQSATGALPTTAVTQPSLAPSPGLGTPAELVDNRPDLQAARARVAALSDEARAAVGRHLPQLALTGQAGRQYFDIGDLRTTDLWSAGIAMSVPLFAGGADSATVDSANAAANAAAGELQQTLLEATLEVQSAWVNESEQVQQLEAFRAQLLAAQQAFDESKARYLAGVDTYLSVFTSLNALQQAQLAVVVARRTLIGARLQLRQALGGPWTRGLRVGAGRPGGAGAVRVESAQTRTPGPRSSAPPNPKSVASPGGRS